MGIFRLTKKNPSPHISSVLSAEIYKTENFLKEFTVQLQSPSQRIFIPSNFFILAAGERSQEAGEDSQ